MSVPVELAIADGSLQLARDDFDSSALGLEVGRVTTAHAASLSSFQDLFRRLAGEVDSLGYDQVLRRIDMEDGDEAVALERTGFELVDVGLTFARPPGPSDPRPSGFDVREAREADVEMLVRELVDERWGSRFERDPVLRRDRIRVLKARWLWNSFKGRTDAFLVATAPTGVAGFVTCIVDKRRMGVIELVGTLPAYRRRGVAGLLLREALAWFDGETDIVRVRSQASNAAAARLYERAGFLLEGADLTFRLLVRRPGAVLAHQETLWNASS